MPKRDGHSFYGKNSYFGKGGHLDRQRRERPIGKGSYGQGSQSGGFGRSSYSMKEGTFDGYPSLSRRRDDGAIDIFYGPPPVDPDDRTHGHAVIRDGKLVYKRRPGESTPIVNKL